MTVEEKIEIAKVSQYLSANAYANGGLYGGGYSKRLSRLLYMVRKNVERTYGINPLDTTLTKTSNYMYALCGGFISKALSLIGEGGTIAPITPGSVASIFPIVIDSSYFSTATEYNDTRIVGKNLTIDIKEIPTILIAGIDFAYTLTGVQILIPGFDATANNYNLRIWEATPGQTAGGSGSSLLGYSYYGDTDYYSDLIANNDIVPYNGTFASTIGSPLSETFDSPASDPSGKYLVFKIPSTQTDKSTWENTGTLNNGAIPDSVFRELISFGGNDYYCTRIAYVFDPSFLTMVLT